jgi:S-adenosylmethionine decarboxylase
MSEKYWGYHLIIDMGECNESINDVNQVENFIRTLVQTIDMKPIGEPIMVYVDEDGQKGVTGVQIITTSTITFHGDDEGKAVYLDVFSCKEFDMNTVLQLTTQYFNPQRIKHSWIIRDAFNSVQSQHISLPA